MLTESITGPVLPTSTAVEVTAGPSLVPSLGVTRTVMLSPLTAAAVLRSRVALVAAAMALAFSNHWYWYVTGSPSASWLVTTALRVSLLVGLPGLMLTESITGAVLP